MHAEGKEVGLSGARTILIISALDPSGGAGAVADVKTARALGFYPCLAITALTYQNTCRISGIYEIPVDVVKSQTLAVLEDVDILCVKVGACAREEFLDVLGGLEVEIVYDPVIRATVGFELTSLDDCLGVAEVSTVITPNESEAELLCRALSLKCEGAEEMAMSIAEALECSVVVTGKVDYVCDGKKVVEVRGKHTGVEVHGTGCVYSTALACYLVENDFFKAAKLAREFVSEAAENPVYAGKCKPVVNV